MATTDERLNYLGQQVSMVATKVDMLVAESQQQREDIRRLQDRQDAMQAKLEAEMKTAQARHDADIKAAQAKHDAEMYEMNQRFYDKVDDITKQLHTNFIQTMLGVGAIMAAVGGLIIATLK